MKEMGGSQRDTDEVMDRPAGSGALDARARTAGEKGCKGWLFVLVCFLVFFLFLEKEKVITMYFARQVYNTTSLDLRRKEEKEKKNQYSDF